ncbi:hypothetical protein CAUPRSCDRAFT_10627 [Caulochytrium protostelioides]|nr:hypothetical protein CAUPRSCDRAFT_10627 [Caulochytrium protostelioides]
MRLREALAELAAAHLAEAGLLASSRIRIEAQTAEVVALLAAVARYDSVGVWLAAPERPLQQLTLLLGTLVHGVRPHDADVVDGEHSPSRVKLMQATWQLLMVWRAAWCSPGEDMNAVALMPAEQSGLAQVQRIICRAYRRLAESACLSGTGARCPLIQDADALMATTNLTQFMESAWQTLDRADHRSRPTKPSSSSPIKSAMIDRMDIDTLSIARPLTCVTAAFAEYVLSAIKWEIVAPQLGHSFRTAWAHRCFTLTLRLIRYMRDEQLVMVRPLEQTLVLRRLLAATTQVLRYEILHARMATFHAAVRLLDQWTMALPDRIRLFLFPASHADSAPAVDVAVSADLDPTQAAWMLRWTLDMARHLIQMKYRVPLHAAGPSTTPRSPAPPVAPAPAPTAAICSAAGGQIFLQAEVRASHGRRTLKGGMVEIDARPSVAPRMRPSSASDRYVPLPQIPVVMRPSLGKRLPTVTVGARTALSAAAFDGLSRDGVAAAPLLDASSTAVIVGLCSLGASWRWTLAAEATELAQSADRVMRGLSASPGMWAPIANALIERDVATAPLALSVASGAAHRSEPPPGSVASSRLETVPLWRLLVDAIQFAFIPESGDDDDTDDAATASIPALVRGHPPSRTTAVLNPTPTPPAVPSNRPASFRHARHLLRPQTSSGAGRRPLPSLLSPGVPDAGNCADGNARLPMSSPMLAAESRKEAAVLSHRAACRAGWTAVDRLVDAMAREQPQWPLRSAWSVLQKAVGYPATESVGSHRDATPVDFGSSAGPWRPPLAPVALPHIAPPCAPPRTVILE